MIFLKLTLCADATATTRAREKDRGSFMRGTSGRRIKSVSWSCGKRLEPEEGGDKLTVLV